MKQRDETHVLAFNGGSSSIKFALFDSSDSSQAAADGSIEGIGESITQFKVNGKSKIESLSRLITAPNYGAALPVLFQWVEECVDLKQLVGVGHRIVHGGPNYWKTHRITSEVLEEIRLLSPFDPKHLPEEIQMIEEFQRRFPDVPQFACFDTAFHQALPRVAQLLPIPRRFEAKGIRRYGFHGLSYAFLMGEFSVIAGEKAAHGRVVLAHLGSGSSLAAVSNGKPIDTSMSFTPASGVPMSTRSGDLDPGLFSYLALSEGFDAKRFSDMVNLESGLIGISETSSDMRQLLKVEQTDSRAAEAIATYCYQIKKTIGGYAAAMNGIDTLIFAGGIGENSPLIRSRICEGLEFLGVDVENTKNETSDSIISKDGGRVQVRVMHTNEERMIATSVFRELNLKTNGFPRGGKSQTSSQDGVYVN